MGSILHMVEIPEVGGDTLFSDSHAAFFGLSDAVKEKLKHTHAVHDYRGFLANPLHKGLPQETVQQLKGDIKFGVAHPILRTHPETGKQGFTLHGGFMRHASLHDIITNEDGSTTQIPWSETESKTMMRLLLSIHKIPEYQCRFNWGKNSIAFWDNRACQHTATGDYFPNVRIGHRVTIAGTRPYFDPDAATPTNHVSHARL